MDDSLFQSVSASISPPDQAYEVKIAQMIKNRVVIQDTVILLVVFVVGVYLAYKFDIFKGSVIGRATLEKTIGLDEALLLGIIMSLGLLVFALRRGIEIRQSAEAILFKTALLEAETETTLDGILAVDEADQIILVNRQFAAHFGIPDELLSRRDDALLRKYVIDTVEDPDTFLKKVNHLYSHRTENSRDELRLKNGTIFDRYSAPLVDSQGQYRGPHMVLPRHH
jgi:PAS domain-containing protein